MLRKDKIAKDLGDLILNVRGQNSIYRSKGIFFTAFLYTFHIYLLFSGTMEYILIRQTPSKTRIRNLGVSIRLDSKTIKLLTHVLNHL